MKKITKRHNTSDVLIISLGMRIYNIAKTRFSAASLLIDAVILEKLFTLNKFQENVL